LAWNIGTIGSTQSLELIDVWPVEFDRLTVNHVGVAQQGLARLLERGGVALSDRDHGVHCLELGKYGSQ
jgi:hypothetical protein